MTRPEEFPRIGARTAREVVARFESEEAQKKVRAEWSPGQYLAMLLEKKELPVAVQFLAYALPKREAVWWSCLCAKPFSDSEPSAGALAAAQRWAADPKEENRLLAFSAALAAGLVSPAGFSALAAFSNQGSLAPPEADPVPPGETMTAQVVTGAVLMAAAAAGEQGMAEQLRGCVAAGLEVARGTNSWASRR